jgi:hypothetical protein
MSNDKKQDLTKLSNEERKVLIDREIYLTIRRRSLKAQTAQLREKQRQAILEDTKQFLKKLLRSDDD